MRKRDISYISIIIILVVIILILIFSLKFGKIDNDTRIPTGNVDVFDINIECEKNENKCKQEQNDESKQQTDIKTNIRVKRNTNYKGKKNQQKQGNNNKIDENINSDEESEIVLEEASDDNVFVDDKTGNYVYQSNLKIFNNAAYNYTNKIAPGVSNTYNFEVHNSSKDKIKYTINFEEEMQYKINLKYRIRKNGKYIVGSSSEYVTLDEVNIPETEIKSNSKDQYSVDWKWFDDDLNDTIAGKNMTEEYKLLMSIYLEQV